MKINNAFSLGLFGGLGVLVALLIGSSVANLATILTYIGAAIFLALGIDEPGLPPGTSRSRTRLSPSWGKLLCSTHFAPQPGYLDASTSSSSVLSFASLVIQPPPSPAPF